MLLICALTRHWGMPRTASCHDYAASGNFWSPRLSSNVFQVHDEPSTWLFLEWSSNEPVLGIANTAFGSSDYEEAKKSNPVEMHY